jgi:hypothetical protein
LAACAITWSSWADIVRLLSLPDWFRHRGRGFVTGVTYGKNNPRILSAKFEISNYDIRFHNVEFSVQRNIGFLARPERQAPV